MNNNYIANVIKNLKTSNLSCVKKHHKHPLGFYFYLIEENSEYDVRLHIWNDDVNTRIPKEPNFPIHDHVWGFDSYVLCGEITNITYSYQRKIDGPYEKYHVNYAEDKSSSTLVKDSDTYELVKLTENTYKKNELYSLESQVVHQAYPSLDFTATLLRTKKKLTIPPTVFGEVGSLSHYRVARSNTQDCSNASLYLNKLLIQI